MYKVAILGCENSHANTFLRLVIEEKVVDDVEFIGVFSEEADAMQKINEKYGIPTANSYDAFVGQVDGIIITARDGKNHYKYAKPYVESGVPMFIDKPITNESAEAVEFMKELKSHGVRISGGSCLMHTDYIVELAKKAKENGDDLIGGHLYAPMQYVNKYGGFPFYSQHLIQMLLTVFGNDVKSLHAFKTDNAINCVFHYPRFNVTADFVDERYEYFASVSTKKGVTGAVYELGGAFLAEFMEFYHVLTGAPSPVGYGEFIIPVFIINAIERAIVSGKEEMIGAVEI